MPEIGTRLSRFAIPILALGLIGCATPGTPSPPGIATPWASHAPPVAPPSALLKVDGGDPVPGQLGTYTWADGGSDSPWLPGTPIAAATGEILAVTLPPDVVLSGWSAVLAPASNTDGEGAIRVGGGPAAMDVVAPAAGSWTLAVTIEFGDPGRATYFWLLEVV